MLDISLGLELGMSRQMYLTILEQNLARGCYQDRRVEVPAPDCPGFVWLMGDLGVAEVKADAIAARGFEQRRGLVRWHRRLEPMIRLLAVLMVVAGKEGGQRKLGEHHQLHAAAVGALYQPHHACHSHLAALGLLDGAKLGGRDRQQTCHAVAPRLRISGWMRVPKFSIPSTKSSKVIITPCTPGTVAISSSMAATWA